MTAVATQYSAKLPLAIANAASAHPATLISAAAMNPARRPTRAIHSEAASSRAPSPARRSSRRASRASSVGERVADQAVHRDEPRGIGEQQRLAAGEQEDVAVGGAHRGQAEWRPASGRHGMPAMRGRSRAWLEIRRYDNVMVQDPLAADVLAFWFGALPHATRGEWFRKDDAFDAEIRSRFGDAVAAGARRRVRGGWTATPRGALARVLLLDQFTRNLFRDTPRGVCRRRATRWRRRGRRSTRGLRSRARRV